jgi:hypothetical protein
MAKATLSIDEVRDLVAQLPDADVYAALCMVAMKRGQDNDQRNVSGMFKGITQLITMLASPMSVAHRMDAAALLREAADSITQGGRVYSTGPMTEKVH